MDNRVVFIQASACYNSANEKRADAVEYFTNLKSKGISSMRLSLSLLRDEAFVTAHVQGGNVQDMTMNVFDMAWVVLKYSLFREWNRIGENVNRGELVPEAIPEFISLLDEAISISSGYIRNCPRFPHISSQVFGLIVKKLCGSKEEWLAGRTQEIQRILLHQLSDENDVWFTAKLLFSIFDEVLNGANSAMLAFRVAQTAAIKDYCEGYLINPAFALCINNLQKFVSSPDNHDPRELAASMQLLALLFSWEFSIIRAIGATDVPYKLFSVRSELASVIIPTNGPSIFDCLIGLVNIVSNYDARYGILVEYIGDILVRASCLKFVGLKGLSTDRRLFVTGTYYAPYFGALANLMAAYTNALKHQILSGGQPSHTMLTLCAAASDAMVGIYLNPEFSVTTFLANELNYSTILNLTTELLDLFNSHPMLLSRIPDADVLFDNCMKLLSYTAHTISVDNRAVDERLFIPISRLVLHGSLILSDFECEDSAQHVLVHEADSSKNTLTSRLKRRAFNIDEDDRFLSRIGMLAEVGRFFVRQIMDLLVDKINNDIRGKTLDVAELDYLKYCMYFVTALFTDEATTLTSTPPELPSFYLSEIGKLQTISGRIPLLFRQPPAAAIAAEALERFLLHLKDSLLDQSLASQLSSVTAASYLTCLTRLARTYGLCAGSTGTDDHPFSRVGSLQTASLFVSLILSCSVASLRTFPGDEYVCRIALLSVHSICCVESSFQPYIFELPEFHEMIVKPLLSSDGYSFRTFLKPKDLTKLMEIVTCTCLPSNYFDNYASDSSDDQRRVTEASLRRLQTLFKYAEPIRSLDAFTSDESLLATATALIRGLLRALVRLRNAPLDTSLKIQPLEFGIMWIFSNRNSMFDATPSWYLNESELPFVSQIAWVQRLQGSNKTLGFESCSQLVSTLKLTLEYAFHVDRVSVEAFAELSTAVYIILREQMANIRMVLKGDHSDRPERAHWLRTFVACLRAVFEWEPAGNCETICPSTEGKWATMKTKFEALEADFCVATIRNSHISDVLNSDGKDNTNLLLSIIGLISHAYASGSDNDLLSPDFARQLCDIAFDMIRKPTLTLVAQDAISSMAFSAVVHELMHQANQGNGPGAPMLPTPSGITACSRPFDAVSAPLAELFAKLVVCELSEREASPPKIFQSLASLATSIGTLISCRPDSFENLEYLLRVSIFNKEPRSLQAAQDHMACYKQILQKALVEARGSAAKGARLTGCSVFAAVNRECSDQFIRQLLSDCRFSRWELD